MKYDVGFFVTVPMALFITFCLVQSVQARESRLVTGHVISADTVLQSIPSSIEFRANQVTVIHPSWFASLFPESTENCSDILSPTSAIQKGEFLVRARSQNQLIFEFRGKPARALSLGQAKYAPVHYEGDAAVHPAFLVDLPGWIHVQLEIHRVNPGKRLTLYVLIGVEGKQKLVPVLSAIQP